MKKPPRKKIKGTANNVVILPGIHNETLVLLAEAHEYFYQYADSLNTAFLTERERILFTSEMSRITIRLSCIMAWLMGRKAVFSGEISESDAHTSYPLECRDVGLHQNIEAESILPFEMGSLLMRSYELYERVARLDDAMREPNSTSS